MRKIIAKNKLKSSNSHRYVQSIGVFKTPNKFHQPRIKECELGKIGKPHQVVNSYQRKTDSGLPKACMGCGRPHSLRKCRAFGKSVENAKIKTTLHLSVSQRVFFESVLIQNIWTEQWRENASNFQLPTSNSCWDNRQVNWCESMQQIRMPKMASDM